MKSRLVYRKRAGYICCQLFLWGVYYVSCTMYIALYVVHLPFLSALSLFAPSLFPSLSISLTLLLLRPLCLYFSPYLSLSFSLSLSLTFCLYLRLYIPLFFSLSVTFHCYTLSIYRFVFIFSLYLFLYTCVSLL